jgi:hypothetical protein
VSVDSISGRLNDEKLTISEKGEGELSITYDGDVNIPDLSYTLLNIQFKPLIAGDEIPIEFSNAECHINNTKAFDLNFATKDGLIKVYDERAHRGKITYKRRNGFRNKKIKLMPDLISFETDKDGSFEILLKENIEYSFDFGEVQFEDYDINIHDLLRLKKHLEGVLQLISATDLLSSDIDGNNVIDSYDFRVLKEYVLDFSKPKNPLFGTWVSAFSETSYDDVRIEEWNRLSNQVFYFGEDNIEVSASFIGDISDYEFDGLKRKNYEDTVELVLSPVFKGGDIEYKISTRAKTRLAGFQYQVQWDAEMYSLAGVQTLNSNIDFSIDSTSGIINVILVEDEENIGSLDYNLNVKLKKLTQNHINQPLLVSLDGHNPIFVDENLEEVHYEIKNSLNVDNERFIHKNYPNPFSYETHFEFILDEGQNVSITIYNSIGEVIISESKFYNEGINTSPIEL